MRIGVIGAGHAGVEAARQASSRGAEAVLFSDEPVLPYFRPRVVALAFGRAELDGIHLRPEKWYRDNGIDLRLNATVRQIDARNKAVNAGAREELFDALIIATGAAPALLAFVRAYPDDVIPLWGVRESLAIRGRLDDVRRLLVLGGGISGVESALYAREAGLEVTVVEKMDRLMPRQFGVAASAVLRQRLEDKGAHVLTGRYATAMSKRDGRLVVTLDDISELTCELVLTTVGAVHRLTLFQEAGIRTDWGVVVDEHLQTSAAGVFACGDIVQHDGLRTATVIRAHQHGRAAADNAVALLSGEPLHHVAEPVVPLSFKHADTEFHSVGPPAGGNLEERVLPGDGPGVYRSVVLRDGSLSGVQMVGSSADLRRLTDLLGRPWQETGL